MRSSGTTGLSSWHLFAVGGSVGQPPSALVVRIGTHEGLTVCGGQPFRTGGGIVRNRDVLVVIPGGDVDTGMARAGERERIEKALRDRIAAGGTLAGILGLLPTLARPGKA